MMPVPSGWPDLSPIPGNNSPLGSETVGPYANDYFQAAYAFIRQLYDMVGKPLGTVDMNGQKITNMANGTNPSDAVNYSQLIATLGSPSGTRLVFQQATAPTGWTIDASASLTDCAMRFNQSVGTGGTAVWSTWNFGGTFTSDGHVLTVAEMAYHGHSDSGHGHGIYDPGHGHGINDGGHDHDAWVDTNIGPNNMQSGSFVTGVSRYGSTQGKPKGIMASGANISIQGSGTGIGINTGYSNISATGGNAAHTHTYKTPQVKYADCVVGIKS